MKGGRRGSGADGRGGREGLRVRRRDHRGDRSDAARSGRRSARDGSGAAATGAPDLADDEDERSWFWRCVGFHIGLVVGFLAAQLPAFIGWAALTAARGRGPADVQSLARMGTLMWAAAALVLAGLPCLASAGLWPLRNRLAVAVPVGVAWFVLGRCVLPDPSLPGVIRSAADLLAAVPR